MSAAPPDERVLVLPAEAPSAGLARRHLRRVAGQVPEAVLDHAEICLTELVTNAVLHAGTDLVVSVTRAGDVLRLSVGDGSPVQPRWVPHTLTAGTGRGLHLIAALSTAHGTSPRPGGAGKDVWCELDVRAADRPPSAAEEALAAEWASTVGELAAAAAPDGAPGDGAEVLRLLDYPVPLGVRMREHREAVLRELQILGLGRRFGDVRTAAVAEGIREILDLLYGHLTPAEARTLQALAAGRDRVDLAYPRRPGHLELIERWRRCMADLAGLSARADLASLATPEDVDALERWIAEELTRQLLGEPPRPWPGRPG